MLVEFALVVTFLCLVVFGTISFGILLGYRQNLTQAATEAARAASVQQDPTEQERAALAAATSALDELHHTCGTTPQAGITCTVSSVFACPDDTTLACRTVTVTLDNDQHAVVPKVPLLSEFIPHQLHATTTVIVVLVFLALLFTAAGAYVVYIYNERKEFFQEKPQKKLSKQKEMKKRMAESRKAK